MRAQTPRQQHSQERLVSLRRGLTRRLEQSYHHCPGLKSSWNNDFSGGRRSRQGQRRYKYASDLTKWRTTNSLKRKSTFTNKAKKGVALCKAEKKPPLYLVCGFLPWLQLLTSRGRRIRTRCIGSECGPPWTVQHWTGEVSSKCDF